MDRRAGQRRDERLIPATNNQWVDVDNGRIFVESHGDGPPLLLLHGWPLDHRVFAPQVAGLASDFRVITFDRRGFGRSTAPPDLRLELDDIDRILDALALERVHLLGMSQGGRIALRYSVTRQERLRSLILQGAVVDGLQVTSAESERVPVAHFAKLANSGLLDVVRQQWLAHPMMSLAPGLTDEARLLASILNDYRGADLAGFDAASYAFDGDLLGALGALTIPVLLITGGHETAARKQHAREILARAPNAQEVIIEHGGHLSSLTEPRPFNDAIRAFCLQAETQR